MADCVVEIPQSDDIQTATTGEQRLLQILAEALVRPSFERCCASGDDFFDAFYSGLADRIPGVGAMFAGTNMRKQNALVQDGISTLIAYAEGHGTARQELERLGRLHGRQRLNIPPAMYPAWVDNLMDVVAAFDSQRTPASERAWRAVLADGIELMISNY